MRWYLHKACSRTAARRAATRPRTRPSGPLRAARRLPSRVNAATSRVKNRRARAPQRGARGVPAPRGKRGGGARARGGARVVEGARARRAAAAPPGVAPVVRRRRNPDLAHGAPRRARMPRRARAKLRTRAWTCTASPCSEAQRAAGSFGLSSVRWSALRSSPPKTRRAAHLRTALERGAQRASSALRGACG